MGAVVLESTDASVTITPTGQHINLSVAFPATGDLTEVTSSVLTITGGTGAVIGTGTSIQVKLAGASQSGYLSSTDWNTFNRKQGALAFSDSLVNTSGTVTLVGDTSTPSASTYYGTNSLSALGFYSLPSFSDTWTLSGTTLAPTNTSANVAVGTVPADTSPALTVGGTATTVSIQGNTYNTRFQTHREGDAIMVDMGIGVHSNTADNSGNLYILKSRGTEAVKTIVQAGDDLGTIYVLGYDGASYVPAFNLDSVVTGTPSIGNIVCTTTGYIGMNPVIAFGTFGTAIFGSGTGYTVLASANTGATNYTFTTPAFNGTAAVLGAASLNATPADATVTNSLTTTAIFMFGFGADATSPWVFTPSKYGKVEVTIDCMATVPSDAFTMAVNYGTGVAPSNGASGRGTTAGKTWSVGGSTFPFPITWSVTRVITGLTVGTAYWFDIATNLAAGNTNGLSNVNVTVKELSN
jgi:hypothetical protein